MLDFRIIFTSLWQISFSTVSIARFLDVPMEDISFGIVEKMMHFCVFALYA